MKFIIIGTVIFLIIFAVVVVILTVMRNNANSDVEGQPARSEYSQ